MALEITDTGITIQTLQEIVEEWETWAIGEFGADVKLSEGDVVGKMIKAAAEREAELQQFIQLLIDVIDPYNATGVLLDILCAITNTTRQDALKSKSVNFEAAGTPGTIINDGRQFKVDDTGELWNIVDGPFTIGGGGTVAVIAEADEVGPKIFSLASTFSIVLGVSGWTSVSATADIDPEEIGRLEESDEELRVRRETELLDNGNDLEGVRASVTKVTGVTLVRVFENTDPINVVDGIDPGAFETVVEGGDDTEVAQAIYDNKPPGAEAFGSTTVNITTSTNDIVPIGLTRPSDIDLWMLIVADSTGAEGSLPANPEQVILDAVLAEANASFNEPDYDVVPEALKGAIFEATKDAKGLNSLTAIDIQLSLDNGAGSAPAYPPGFPAPGTGVDPYTTAIRVMAIRERADFDSGRIGVTII